jgi:putative transposase
LKLICTFKTVSAKHINLIRHTTGSPVLQRNYYEQIIRNQKEYEDIWNYIDANPKNWLNDQLNPYTIQAEGQHTLQ